MNKKKALEELKKYLTEYYNYGFIFHPRFIEELSSLLKSVQGHEAELFNLLAKQLSFVKDLGTQAHTADSNEHLKYKSKQLYTSLHLSSKNFNIRFIMTFDNDLQPVFLLAFYERSGKSSTDYSKYEEPAKKRFRELYVEGEYNE